MYCCFYSHFRIWLSWITNTTKCHSLAFTAGLMPTSTSSACVLWATQQQASCLVGNSSVVRVPDSWLKGHRFESLLEQRENFLLQGRLSQLCWLLFQHPFQPCVTAAACKRSQSFCQKCRWQVTAKHTYPLRMWLCMMWHGAWLYGVHRTCAETAAVSRGTSHASAVSTPLRWIFKNAL